MGQAQIKSGVSVDILGEVIEDLLPLTNLSLSTVRQFNDLYLAKRKSSSHYVPIKRMRAMFKIFIFEKYIADCFGMKDAQHHEVMGNILYVLSAMIIYSKTNWFYKIRFLHALFDFDESGSITLDEFVILVSSWVHAVGIMTHKRMPHIHILRPFIEQVFHEADVRPDNMITLEEAFNWVKADQQCITLFTSNEPPGNLIENTDLFAGLHSVMGAKNRRRTMRGPKKSPRKREHTQVVSTKASQTLNEFQTQLISDVFDILKDSQTKASTKQVAIELIDDNLANPKILGLRDFQNDKVILEEVFVTFQGLGQYIKQATDKSSTVVKSHIVKPAQIREYKQLFDAYDKNRSGGIDTEEIAEAFAAVASEGQVDAIINQYDYDNDHELQFYEFLKLLLPPNTKIPKKIVNEYLRKQVTDK